MLTNGSSCLAYKVALHVDMDDKHSAGPWEEKFFVFSGPVYMRLQGWRCTGRDERLNIARAF